MIGNSGAPQSSIATNTPVSCFGGSNGSLDITVAGGTPTYTYSWSNGANTQDISSLIAGTYTVTVTDQNFCVNTNSMCFLLTLNNVVGQTQKSKRCNFKHITLCFRNN